MRVSELKRRLTYLALCLLAFPGVARATTIDFDELLGPSPFPELTPQPPLPYPNVDGSGVDVTFDGGMILTVGLNVPANQTSIYGTACFGQCDTPVLLNPLTVKFSSPIENFSLDVISGFTQNATFLVYDNAGNSITFELPPGDPEPPAEGGWKRVGFAATGDIVYIQQLGEPIDGFAYDFFIDNITFNEPLNPVPEPASLVLLGSGLVGAAVARRRRRYTSAK